MDATQWPALVTLLTMLLFAGTIAAVGRARTRYGINAPATTGNPDFERVFRAQMNTLESIVLMLPCLWLAAHYFNPTWAGVAGLVWVAARIWYAVGYVGSAAGRHWGYVFGAFANLVLLVMALWGVGKALFTAV